MVFSTDNEKFVLLYHLQNATFWKLNYFDISKNMDVDGKIQKEEVKHKAKHRHFG